jgi:hypothetical protein
VPERSAHPSPSTSRGAFSPPGRLAFARGGRRETSLSPQRLVADRSLISLSVSLTHTNHNRCSSCRRPRRPRRARSKKANDVCPP